MIDQYFFRFVCTAVRFFVYTYKAFIFFLSFFSLFPIASRLKGGVEAGLLAKGGERGSRAQGALCGRATPPHCAEGGLPLFTYNFRRY